MIEVKFDLVQFLELITYNQLFNYVDVPSNIGAIIALADPDKTICYCEPINVDLTTIWYPISSWIAECKRRKHIDDILAEPKPVRVSTPNVSAQLLAAALAGNEEEVKRLTELMKRSK